MARSMLAPGQELITTTGAPCRVERLLGIGGQGEVYLVKLGGSELALKWYYPEMINNPAFRQSLGDLVQRGSPSPRFLWPLDLVVPPKPPPGKARFGYLMRLRNSQFHDGRELLSRRIEPSNRALATAAMFLADAFLQLHSRGLCYCDVSLGNVFIEPDSGDVLICDNDNVGINGRPPFVKGTQFFMAPEVVRNEALPDANTDRYSLAVLLFHLFIVHHPLIGQREAQVQCVDPLVLKRLLGDEPLFIFDPQNPGNRPVPNLHDNALLLWPQLPKFVQELFVRAFTTGLNDPSHGRVGESEWRAAMSRLRDGIVPCPHCYASSKIELFYDPAPLEQPATPAPSCWRCKRKVPLPWMLGVAGHRVMLNMHARLYPHHLANQPYDFDRVLAEVTAHPQNPTRWGLRNQMGEAWQATMPDGTSTAVLPGKAVPLVHGARINFGKCKGEVKRL